MSPPSQEAFAMLLGVKSHPCLSRVPSHPSHSSQPQLIRSRVSRVLLPGSNSSSWLLSRTGTGKVNTAEKNEGPPASQWESLTLVPKAKHSQGVGQSKMGSIREDSLGKSHSVHDPLPRSCVHPKGPLNRVN